MGENRETKLGEKSRGKIAVPWGWGGMSPPRIATAFTHHHHPPTAEAPPPYPNTIRRKKIIKSRVDKEG